jgi:hypothetical protein
VKYPRYGSEVNAILDVARAASQAHKAYPRLPVAEITGHLAEAAENWAWSLVEIILDHEEREQRHAQFWSKWKRWRNKRESIRRIARPNAVYLGEALPLTKKIPRRGADVAPTQTGSSRHE